MASGVCRTSLLRGACAAWVGAAHPVQMVTSSTQTAIEWQGCQADRFRVVDAMLTNFHLPKSTLLMLVAAFIGRERMDRDYHHAISNGYRFYSYGDTSFLLPCADALT